MDKRNQPACQRTLPGEPLGLQSWNVGLLELYEGLDQPRYRFRAEIRHEDSSNAGVVGVYFAHREYTAKDCSQQVFLYAHIR